MDFWVIGQVEEVHESPDVDPEIRGFWRGLACAVPGAVIR
jgi:hypothetical protein